MKKLTAEWCRNHIESMRANGLSLLEEYYVQALEIALQVLEKQESKRQVTLREAVSELRNLRDESGGYNFEALRAEQDDSDWISCSERTPEPLDWVIAYDEVGTVKAYICKHTGEWIRDNGDELYRVTYWQPLPSPPQPKTDTYRQIENDGWIEWGGGECPLPVGCNVEIRTRIGGLRRDLPAHRWGWQHLNDFDDIIAYRVIENDGR